MIVFDLQCQGASHRFEAWFGSSDDYADQLSRGLIRCPVCDDSAVEKAVMAPAVSPKGNRQLAGPADPGLVALKARILSECDDVGSAFAVEARERHAAKARGEPARGCFGEATLSDTAELLSEGVPVAPLWFRPPRLQDS